MLVKDKRKCTWYGGKITETQYDEILSMLRNRPTAPDGLDYRLTKELEWELYELPPKEETELTADETLEISFEGEV